MCRGFQQNERERLKIKAFHIHFSTKNNSTLPDYLTLHFPPRINGSLLEINGLSIRPGSPAFLSLHRGGSDRVTYGCRERVVLCEGVKFGVYVGDAKALTGIFRKGFEGHNWKMDCKSDDVVEGVREAEVSVAAEGHMAVINERVAMRRSTRRRRCCELEEIPEEREEGSDVCWCSECGGGVVGEEGGVDGRDGEVEVEGVGWAVDVGIWVVCLGVGFLVSRASSSKRLRRMRFI